MFKKGQIKVYLMELLLVAKPLHLGLKPLPALGNFARVGVLDQEGLLLLLVFHRVFVFLVDLQPSSLHAAPPDVLVQADLTLKIEVPQVDLLDVGCKIALCGECLIAGECVLLKVAWGRSPGAGKADAEVDSLAVSPHVSGITKALATVRALVRPRHLVDRLNVPGEVVLLTERLTTGETFEVLNLRVNGSHVVGHGLWTCKDL